jgi:hypothetical protein
MQKTSTLKPFAKGDIFLRTAVVEQMAAITAKLRPGTIIDGYNCV